MAAILLDSARWPRRCVWLLSALWAFSLPSFPSAPARVRLDAIARIPIGNAGYMAALTPDGTALYVAQNRSHSIAIVNLRARKLTRTIPLPYVPSTIAISPDGKRVYVGLWGGQATSGRLGVLDASTGILSIIHAGGPVPDLALSADGTTLYMAMCRSGLRKLDTRTGAVQTIYRQFCPWGIALSPDQKSIWVNFQGGGPGGRWGHDSIAKFDAETGKLLGVVNQIANVGGTILVSRDGKTVWADGADACISQTYDHAGCPAVPAGIVHVIDAANMRLLRTLAKAAGGLIAFSGDQTFVACAGAHLLLVDARNFSPVGDIPGRFIDLAFSPDGEYAYATSMEAPEIVVLRVRKTP